MTEARIGVVVKEDSLCQTGLGSIIGEIHFALGRSPFPELDWTDFPVVVLSWWLDSVASLIDGDSSGIDLRFMDGPFLLEAIPIADGLVRLNCIHDASKRQIVASFETKPTEFCSVLLNAARSVERACMERGWQSDDTLALSRSIANLERRLTRS